MTGLTTAASARAPLFRYSSRDAVLVSLAAAHGVLLLCLPRAPLVAVGLWWNSNTISHCFLHKPYFSSRVLNAAFSLYLSVLLGVPQSLWKARHLAHHAGGRARCPRAATLAIELGAILVLWGTLAAVHPVVFFSAYLPGYVGGLLLCQLHGHYEHARGTLSHHGRLYNWLFFNDGYHVEHHRRPQLHWTRLPREGSPVRVSRWPPVLRWLEGGPLEWLERVASRSAALRGFLLRTHRRALAGLLRDAEPEAIRRVSIVGGGLFPRSALVLGELLPGARIRILDGSPENLERARGQLPEGVELIHAWYDGGELDDADLVVFPLAFRGDRAAVYESPPAPRVLVHDWLWRRRGASRMVSWLLLKRLNLVRA